MSENRKIFICGGCQISSSGIELLSHSHRFSPSKYAPVFPEFSEIFKRPIPRYGRFDNYTKLGCIAAAKTLHDSGFDIMVLKSDCGIIISTNSECIENDINYYKTTIEQDGILSSPNLFSYTLPNVVLGECAVYAGLAGASLTVSDNFNYGYEALKIACRMILSDGCEMMIAGWLDWHPDFIKNIFQENAVIQGAAFVMLSNHAIEGAHINQDISIMDDKIILSEDIEIKSIADLFNMCEK